MTPFWKPVQTAPSPGPAPIGEVLAELLARLPPAAPAPGDRPRGRGRTDAIATSCEAAPGRSRPVVQRRLFSP